MGHCVCLTGYVCPWCRPATGQAETEREHPFEAWDINAETAALYAGGGL